MVTGQDIAATTEYAISCDGGYIYGTANVLWTEQKQKALIAKYNSDPEKYASYKYSAEYGSKWYGHRVWDCSGLTSWAAQKHGIKLHHGSNSCWKYDLSQKGDLLAGMDLPIGALTFTGTDKQKPHIGTYTGNGMVTEAAGTKAGCIQTKLHGGKWKYWGLAKGVSYDFIPGGGGPGTDKPTLRKGDTGTYVTLLQTELIQRGYDLPKYGADGKFGNETLSAVKAFQDDNGLQPDGVVGAGTWAALDKMEPIKRYTVTIPNVTLGIAEALVTQYPGAWMDKEGGAD